MKDDIRIPYGLCEIIFGNRQKYDSLTDEQRQVFLDNYDAYNANELSSDDFLKKMGIDDINLLNAIIDEYKNLIELKYFANTVQFNAIPTYKKYSYGKMQTGYLLEKYDVYVDIELEEETYQNMQFAYQGFKKDTQGNLYDDPSKIDMTGKLLTIHPLKSGDSKEFDLNIFNVIVDPENPYKRVYGKEKDTIKIRFLGQKGKKIDNNDFSSYFYIGDAQTAGVI